jgi:hypothetical protein
MGKNADSFAYFGQEKQNFFVFTSFYMNLTNLARDCRNQQQPTYFFSPEIKSLYFSAFSGKINNAGEIIIESLLTAIKTSHFLRQLGQL